jgi:hypothetical protein
VDPRSESVLRRFVDKLGGEVGPAAQRGCGRSESGETDTELQEVVTGFLPDLGVLELELRSGQSIRLHFDEAELLTLLSGAGEDGLAVWGESLSAEESAARLLTVYLEESTATRQAPPSGWWEYEKHGFTPLPPWEAFSRRRQRG